MTLNEYVPTVAIENGVVKFLVCPKPSEVVADPVIRLVKTTSTSFEVPVPTTPPFVMMPFVLFSVEFAPLTIRIWAKGTAFPFWVLNCSETDGGRLPAVGAT